MDIKYEISKLLPENLQNLVTTTNDSSKGDYCVPCFALAKEYRKSPMAIAQELATNIHSNLIEKCEAVNGYLNFFINKKAVAQNVIENYKQSGNKMLANNVGENKTVCIDYSSVNLAKYMHIGHLCTTIIGESIARIMQASGYKVVRINYVGDFGTPFGKMICGYKLWGSKQDVEIRGVDALQDYYVQFCKHEDDETYAQMARDTFTKLENKDPELTELYNWFIETSIGETKRLCSMLGANFDDWRGEHYYSQFIPELVQELQNDGLLQNGEQGAKIVDLGDLGVSVILKNDGSSLYITRDLCTATKRYEEYKFDKSLYVTDVSQKLHFKQLFTLLDLMHKPFAKNLHHIEYGRLSLPEGKISSRKGKQALLKDIINEAISKAKEVISDRNLEDPENVAKVVGIGATVYSVLKKDKIKDSVYDINSALNFDGDTSPYMQYTYARCCSILRKCPIKDNVELNYDYITSPEAFEILKLVNNFNETVSQALNNYEPSIISKKVMELCKLINIFYHKEKVITDNETESQTKLQLINLAKETIRYGLHLICIDTVEQM